MERKKIQYKKTIPIAYLRAIGWTAAIIVLAGIVLGFLAGGTPGTERQRQFDIATSQNLSRIAGAVNSYAMSQGRLPDDLQELKSNPTYSYVFSNVSEEKLTDYQYRIIDRTHYALCGTFNLATKKDTPALYVYGDQNWSQHTAGRVCRQLTATFKYDSGSQPGTVSP